MRTDFKFQMFTPFLSKRVLAFQLSVSSKSVSVANIYQVFAVHHFMSTGNGGVNITEKFLTPREHALECQKLGNKQIDA